jgi:hypothetical protein
MKTLDGGVHPLLQEEATQEEPPLREPDRIWLGLGNRSSWDRGGGSDVPISD